MSAHLDRTVRQDVGEVLVRYASGIDRRDWALFRTCFTPDCVVDYGDVGVWHSADEVSDFMEQAHEPFGHVLHRITNESMQADGDGVVARSYVDAIIMDTDNVAGLRSVGYYDDELVRTATGWQIARRRFTPVLFETNVRNGAPNPPGTVRP